MQSQDALKSVYIIDGHEMEATPWQILSALCNNVYMDDMSPGASREGLGEIIDESADPLPGNDSFDPSLTRDYAAATTAAVRNGFPLPYGGSLSRLAVARGLLRALFRNGRFKLGDLVADASWTWDEAPVGSMASFYESVSWACEYLDNLGVKLRSYKYVPGPVRRLEVSCNAVVQWGDEDTVFEDNPFISANASIQPGMRCPQQAEGGKGDWVIYVPFDTCHYRLGGSLLAQVTGKDGGKSPDLVDADYFIDCYEVVREFVEDGVAVAGRPVTDGGLLTALFGFVGKKAFTADIASVMRSAEETDPVKLLFGEIPGVLLEIRDSDFDYIDAEFLLQDVAYYPLGQFSGVDGELDIDLSSRTALKSILVSLMEGASEGED